MTMDEIIKMAFELGLAISQSDEMKSLKQMQAKLGDNPETSALVMLFQEAQTKADNKLRDGLTITENEADNLQSLQTQLNDNALIQDIIREQEKFGNLMDGVYFAINQALEGECSTDCSTSDCSSCGCGCGM